MSAPTATPQESIAQSVPSGFAGFNAVEVKKMEYSGFRPHTIPEGNYESDEGCLRLREPLPTLLREQKGHIYVLMRVHEFQNVSHLMGDHTQEPTEKLPLTVAGLSLREAEEKLLDLINFHNLY